MHPTTVSHPPVITHFQAVKEIVLSLWRRGEYEEARKVAKETLESQGPFTDDETLALNLCLAMVEQSDGKQEEARNVFLKIAHLADKTRDDQLRAKFLSLYAYTLRRLNLRGEAIDMLTGASIYFEQVEKFEECAYVDNNLANILVDAERFEEAHYYLARAKKHSKDKHALAQIDESIAGAYEAQDKLLAALFHAAASVAALEGTERQPLFKESFNRLKRICDKLDKQFKAVDERPLIEAAFAKHPGKITAAARMLGMHHQTLRWKLENQYPDLDIGVPPKKKPRGPYAVPAKRA